MTYQPEHTAGGYIRLKVWRFETEFSTSYRGRMHVEPVHEADMRPALTGSLYLQVRVCDSFFLYGGSTTYITASTAPCSGYPEQGRTIIGGLRISI